MMEFDHIDVFSGALSLLSYVNNG